MGLQPQRPGTLTGIDTGLFPPYGYIAAAVDLAMMSSAQWYGEFIAYLATERPALRESQVMGIRGAATENQAGLMGHISDVVPINGPGAAPAMPTRSYQLFSTATALWAQFL